MSLKNGMEKIQNGVKIYGVVISITHIMIFKVFALMEHENIIFLHKEITTSFVYPSSLCVETSFC